MISASITNGYINNGSPVTIHMMIFSTHMMTGDIFIVDSLLDWSMLSSVCQRQIVVQAIAFGHIFPK